MFTKLETQKYGNFHELLPKPAIIARELPAYKLNCRPSRITGLLQFDFYVNASWQIQLHQRINRFVRWINDVHQTLMGTDLELVT